jgi:hypothetical protein
MVRLDYLYVTTWSLGRDLWLVLRTFPILGKGERLTRAWPAEPVDEAVPGAQIGDVGTLSPATRR